MKLNSIVLNAILFFLIQNLLNLKVSAQPKWYKEDFKVNDAIGTSSQQNPAIATNGNGDFVVVWEDDGDGTIDIYARRYNTSGVAQGSVFKTNDDNKSIKNLNPDVAMDSNGNFVIVWKDDRNKSLYYDIYAQRYNNQGVKQGSNFKVNDNSNNSDRGSPSITIDKTGNIIIAWNDKRNTDMDIYCQKYDASGIAQGINFKVNDETNLNQTFPTISSGGDDYFIIVWEDERNSNKDIYAQLYNSSRVAQGSNIKINTDSGNKNQYSPSVAMDQGGNFVVVWNDLRNKINAGDPISDIYAQRFNESGIREGTNFKINDQYGIALDPSVSVGTNGDFVVIWDDLRNTNYTGIVMDIYAQRFNAFGIAQGLNFKVNNESLKDISQTYPDIAVSGINGFVASWRDGRSGNPDIYAQLYTIFGNTKGSNFIVSSDKENAIQTSPSIAHDENGNFMVVWEDDYDPGYFYKTNIFAKRYNSSGDANGTGFKVNDDTGINYQFEPDVAMNKDGYAVVVWEDGRYNNKSAIYVQIYTNSGAKQGFNFRCDDDSKYKTKVRPAVAIDDNGNFVVVWADRRDDVHDSYHNIYAQRYNSLGEKQGSNFKVNDDLDIREHECPDISMDKNGNFVVIWQDERNGKNIYAQRYNSNGIKEGVNFKVNNISSNGSDWMNPSIAMNRTGNFVVSWYRASFPYWEDSHIFTQRYNLSGMALGSNFEINDETIKVGPSAKTCVSINDDGEFVISWTNTYKHIYGQRFSINGEKISKNFLLTKNYAKGQGFPNIIINGNYIINCWVTSSDIWANIIYFDESTGIENFDLKIPTEYKLHLNYPNPFNPSTIIKYDLPKKGMVVIKIYDMIGREVKILVNEYKSAGSYIKEFNADGLSSGVYFYQIKADEFLQTKKMILLR